MRVRILDKGFANYSGTFGHVEFVDGVSAEISAAEAERLGCILPIETVEADEEAGRNPSATQRLIDTRGDRAPVESREGRFGRRTSEEQVEPEQVEPEQPPIEVKQLSYEFSRETLEALADKEGISGLRAFAAAYGVKGRGIAEIIDELLGLRSAVVSEKPAVEQAQE